MKQKDMGFSLIEIIVAVLIMGIISATAIASVSTVHNAKVDSASSVFGNIMKVTREKAMGLDNTTVKGSDDVYTSDIFLLLYIKNGNVYADTYQTIRGYVHLDDGSLKLDAGGNKIPTADYQCLRSEKLCNDYVKISFMNHNRDTISTELTESTRIKIYFKKSTGGICSILKCSQVEDETFTKSDLAAYDSTSGTYADTIVFRGPSEKKVVTMAKATGRCYLDDTEESAPTPTSEP